MYPNLTEEGKEEAHNLVQVIIKAVKKQLDSADFYCDIPTYIESDSWTNFKNSMMDGFKDYPTAKLKYQYDFKEIRKKMLKDNYNEIITELNQDNLEEIKSLNERIDWLEKYSRDRN